MSNAKSGLAVLTDLTTGSPTNKQKIARLRALIPDPDSTSTSGAQAGGGMLDEMSPAVAAQLQVELVAIEASITNV